MSMQDPNIIPAPATEDSVSQGSDPSQESVPGEAASPFPAQEDSTSGNQGPLPDETQGSDRPVADTPLPAQEETPGPTSPTTGGAVFPASDTTVPAEDDGSLSDADPSLQPQTPEESGHTSVDPAKTEFPVPHPASGGRPGPDIVTDESLAALPVPHPASGGRPGPDIVLPGDVPAGTSDRTAQPQEPVMYQSLDTAVDETA